MLKYSKIKSPTFVIKKSIARENISRMMSKLPNSCTFRPHFKTHNNKFTAKIFQELGIDKITVSSVEMAMNFRSLGFRDITIAFPFNPREHKRLNKLCSNTKLGITISNIQSAKAISKMQTIEASAWIEIDTGYKRSGISWDNYENIEECIKIIHNTKHLKFLGFINHNGETYSLHEKSEILKSTKESIRKMLEIKNKFSKYNAQISIGDTPGCSFLTSFEGIDEIRPGNFVYYDLMMLEKGVCTINNVAATVLCQIVDINPERKELVIHGGAIHFSKELIDINGNKVFGKVVKHIGREKSDIEEYIYSLSQEHGIIKLANTDVSNFKIGDLLEIIPVHSCLTANLMKGKTLHY